MTVPSDQEPAEEPGHPKPPPFRPAIQLGVAVTLVIVVSLFVLVSVVGPLIDPDYRVESLLVVGTVPVILGAALLLLDIELPSWWRRG